MRSGLLGAILVVLGAADFAQAAVNISDKPTKHMSCSAGVCSPTAKKAVLNATDLANLLQAADVTVTTGSGAITIEITSALSWASAGRLTLDANCNVSVKAPVTVAGPGGLTIVTNIGGSGCDLLFFPGGKIDFWDLGSSLIINGNAYGLAGNIRQLKSKIVANPSGSYALTKDYDAAVDGTHPMPPIPMAFSGAFEGLGHAISNLTIKDSRRDSCIGFFATNSGTVRDISLTNANVSATRAGKSVGTLVGCNTGAIRNASADGVVHGVLEDNVGGLIGNNAGSIVNAGADVAATGDNSVKGKGEEKIGGLAGLNSGDVSQSHAAGAVTAAQGSFAGGLIGWSTTGQIYRSYATGLVSHAGTCCGGHAYAGGLVGAGNNIAQSFATGGVTAGNGWDNGGTELIMHAGGLVGAGSNIVDSYALGTVQAGTHSIVGGLVARGDSIGQSYSTAAPTGDDYTGGLVGYDPDAAGPFANTDWDLDTSGIGDPSQGAGNIANDAGITGLSDAQLKSALPAGFDPAIWGQNASINNGYPYLLANLPP
ncbi:MAG TPA: hypothetical protein VIM02_04590 [Rhizomicrobium sp.]